MDNERNLLFGVVAFQSGAVDADGLAETCADWTAEPTQPLADMMVNRGLMTDEQKTQVDGGRGGRAGRARRRPARHARGDDRRPLARGPRRGRGARRLAAGRPEAAPAGGRTGGSRRAGPTLAGRGRRPRPLHPDPPPRQGWHGPGLAGPRRLTRPPDRAEGAAAGPVRQFHRLLAVPLRGQDHGAARASRDRPGLRAGRGRRRRITPCGSSGAAP